MGLHISNNLNGVHPTLALKVNAILNQMAIDGTPMKIVEGLRTTERQQEIYAKQLADGHVVTRCNGVKVKSPHQARADGYGWACDLGFQGPDPFGLQHPWDKFGLLAEAEGLIWGGRFKFVDLDHVELKL